MLTQMCLAIALASAAMTASSHSVMAAVSDVGLTQELPRASGERLSVAAVKPKPPKPPPRPNGSTFTASIGTGAFAA